MPFPGGTQGAHNDSQHQDSAKRDTSGGVAAIDISGNIVSPAGFILLRRDGIDRIYIGERTAQEQAIWIGRNGANDYTANIFEGGVAKRIQTSSMKNAANGIAGLDASALVAVANLPVNIASGIAGLDALNALNAHRFRSGFVGGFGSNYTVVAGSWQNDNNASQTDFDDILVSGGAGIVDTTSWTNLDEIKWPNVVLNAGTYKIVVVHKTSSADGIIEILHGTNSIGTIDGYSAGLTYNVVSTLTYSPTVRNVLDLRFRVNGKNGSSSGYRVNVSRLEIFKTA